MLPGPLHFDYLKSFEPPLGLADRRRRNRHRPTGARIRRISGRFEE